MIHGSNSFGDRYTFTDAAAGESSGPCTHAPANHAPGSKADGLTFVIPIPDGIHNNTPRTEGEGSSVPLILLTAALGLVCVLITAVHAGIGWLFFMGCAMCGVFKANARIDRGDQRPQPYNIDRKLPDELPGAGEQHLKSPGRQTQAPPAPGTTPKVTGIPGDIDRFC